MIHVIQLEVRSDGKVYHKAEPTNDNPRFVVESEGRLVAALSDGERTAVVTMTPSWVDERTFEEIMTRVELAIRALAVGVEASKLKVN